MKFDKFGACNNPNDTISDDTVKHFSRYQKLYHPRSDGSQPMFYTVRRGVKTYMSDDNVLRFIKKYGEVAKAENPDIPERVHPHMLRRSRSMHLYQAGMPLAILSEWLGHESPETTLIYAYADTEMKRKAIEQAETNIFVRPAVNTNAGIWEGNKDLIQRLCGLS